MTRFLDVGLRAGWMRAAVGSSWGQAASVAVNAGGLRIFFGAGFPDESLFKGGLSEALLFAGMNGAMLW